MNQSNADSTNLQIRSMREALERSGRATANAQDMAVRALRDAQIERQRVRQMLEALDQASHRLEDLESENRRLRSLVGTMAAKAKSPALEAAAIRSPEPGGIAMGDFSFDHVLEVNRDGVAA